MDRINLDDLQRQADSRQLKEQKQPVSDGRPNKKIMFRLWVVMQETYGHQFNSQYGEEPTDSWERLLTGITPQQISDGLNKIPDRQDSWPPNAKEFRAMCLPTSISPDGKNSAAYKLYKPEKLIEDKTYISRRKKAGKAALEAMKAELNIKDKGEDE